MRNTYILYYAINKSFCIVDKRNPPCYTLYMSKLKMFLYVLLGFMFIDFIMFFWWVLSGQMPLDNFYVGVITRTILLAIL